MICGAININNQHLYILNKTYTDENMPNANHIIKFETSPIIKPVDIYKLPGIFFTTFCVDEDEKVIYAYNIVDNTIGKYLIPKKNE